MKIFACILACIGSAVYILKRRKTCKLAIEAKKTLPNEILRKIYLLHKIINLDDQVKKFDTAFHNFARSLHKNNYYPTLKYCQLSYTIIHTKMWTIKGTRCGTGSHEIYKDKSFKIKKKKQTIEIKNHFDNFIKEYKKLKIFLENKKEKSSDDVYHTWELSCWLFFEFKRHGYGRGFNS